MSNILTLSLTQAAEQHLATIAQYTLQNFGDKQAQKYYLGLAEALSMLTHYPETGTNQSHIRFNLRRLVYQLHAIYYRIDAKNVIVLRVLNARQDPLSKL